MNAELLRRAGLRLRQERVHAGITLGEMAACIGLTNADIRNIEEGLLSSNVHALASYANALCMDADYLFSDT